jgi:hypothetical protein
VFVSPQGPTDSTHFRTIEDAIAAQTAPGAVIAVDPGTYVESLEPGQPVTVIGRCAAQVIVSSPGGNTSGFRLRSFAATLEGVTLKGMYSGAAIDTGGALTLRNCVLDGNREVGVTVDGAGSSLTIDGTVIRGTTSQNATWGRGVQVQNGATATVTFSAITGNRSFGVFVTGAGSSLAVSDSVISDTVADVSGAYGVGATSQQADLSVTRCAIFKNRVTNLVFAGGTGSVKDSVIHDGVPVGTAPNGQGLLAQDSAVVTVQGSTFTSNSEAGLGATGAQLTATSCTVRDTKLRAKDTAQAGVRDNGQLTLDGCALVTNNAQGVAVETGSTATVTGTLIRDSLPSRSFVPHAVEVLDACATFSDVSVLHSTSLGILFMPDAGCPPLQVDHLWVSDVAAMPMDKRGTGIAVQSGQVQITQSAISQTADIGLLVYGDGTFVTLDQSTVTDSHTPDGIAGNAVAGLTGTRTDMTSCHFKRAEGEALLFDASRALLFDSIVANSGIGLGAQDGSVIDVQAAKPDEPDPLHVVVGATTVFSGNKTRVGSDVLPLPQPF